MLREWTQPHERRGRRSLLPQRHDRRACPHHGNPVVRREREQLPVTRNFLPGSLSCDGAAMSRRIRILPVARAQWAGVVSAIMIDEHGLPAYVVITTLFSRTPPGLPPLSATALVLSMGNYPKPVLTALRPAGGRIVGE